MIKFMRSAVVVVACVAGFGAWGDAKVAVDTVHTYASELFGEGHAAIKYPSVPTVVLTIPGNTAETTAADVTDANIQGHLHEGSAEVTFTLLGGATFDGNVTGLLWDNDLNADGPDADGDENGDDTGDGDDGNPATGIKDNDFVTAPGTVASILSGGRKGDNSITIKVEAATTAAEGTRGNDLRANYHDGRGDDGNAQAVEAAGGQSIAFKLPSLSNLSGSLKDASKAKTMVRQVSLRAESRIVSGAFTDGYLTGNQLNVFTTAVVKSRDAVTVSITDPNTKNIVIKGDSAFKSIKGAVGGYVELATVTVSTRTEHVTKAATDAAGAKRMYQQGTLVDTTGVFTAQTTDPDIVIPAKKAGAKVADTLYGLDGKMVDAGLRGVLTMSAMGTRDLFNEDDALFIDYDGNKKMGGSEAIALDGDMGMGTALSIDSDVYKGGVGNFKVYYMAGGKVAINHGSMIKLTANVDYSDPSATDEAAKNTSTTFNFEGVTSEVMAYAIPHSTNGTGDKANVRVRCEASAGCRVFVECWDDMGMRAFGEAGEIAGDALAKWDAEAIEGVIGVTEPTSRHSCRILSAGNVSVQQLTRDGNSKTLVNNTYVGQ